MRSTLAADVAASQGHKNLGKITRDRGRSRKPMHLQSVTRVFRIMKTRQRHCKQKVYAAYK